MCKIYTSEVFKIKREKKKRDLPTRKRPVTFFTVQKSNASNITISTKFNTNDLEIV